MGLWYAIFLIKKETVVIRKGVTQIFLKSLENMA